MTEYLANPHLRRLIILRSIEGALLMLVVGAAYLGYGHVQQARVEAVRQEAKLGAQPQYLLGLSQIQSDLRDREHDIERILQLVEDPKDIVVFIESIEQAAKQQHVTLVVSSIDEVQSRDEAGQVIEPTGPFRSIQLTLTGKGAGADLVEYVHTLENGPRLVIVRQWEVRRDPGASVAVSQSQAAREIDATAAAKAPTVTPAELRAEVILLVRNEKY